MRITAKLAYSQLKINKTRTRWSMAAVILSTSLTTTVCSLAVSVNKMIKDLLEIDYSYTQSYSMLVIIPSVILGFIIAAMSIAVISNVFRVSAQERMSQFGILKCTGATSKQILSTVIYEGVWLCLTGIPIGIIVGLILTLVSVLTANYILGDLNALTHIMMKEMTFELKPVLSMRAILISALLSFMTIMYSVWKPAHRAAKISAIDCIHQKREIKAVKIKNHGSNIIKKLFGFEGMLADKNISRGKNNFNTTVTSPTVGVVLFVSLGGLSTQAKAIENYIQIDSDYTVISDYTSYYTRKTNDKTKRQQTIYTKPIDSERGELITERLRQYEDMDILGMGNDMETYYTVLPRELVSEEMRALYEGESTYEFEAEIIVLDSIHYKSLCDIANVPLGSAILLNHYKYNDFGQEVSFEPFSSDIKEIELIKADKSATSITIGGVLTKEQIPRDLFYANTRPVRIVVEKAEVRSYSWECSPTDTAGFIKYANEILNEEFPEGKDSSYMEAGFNTSVYRLDEYNSVMNVVIVLFITFIYSFTALLMLIGLTNVISTISTNVMLRSREFAMLKSVGMTTQSLKRMLIFESILCSVRAIMYGMPIGIVITILFNLPVRILFPIPYKLPWLTLILCTLSIFLITWAAMIHAAHKLKGQNIMESIRV